MTAPAVPGGRPGGWVSGIGWVARQLDLDHKEQRTGSQRALPSDAVIVTRWADGSTPEPPAPQPEGVDRSELERVARWLRMCRRQGHPTVSTDTVIEQIDHVLRPAPGSDKR